MQIYVNIFRKTIVQYINFDGLRQTALFGAQKIKYTPTWFTQVNHKIYFIVYS